MNRANAPTDERHLPATDQKVLGVRVPTSALKSPVTALGAGTFCVEDVARRVGDDGAHLDDPVDPGVEAGRLDVDEGELLRHPVEPGSTVVTAALFSRSRMPMRNRPSRSLVLPASAGDGRVLSSEESVESELVQRR